MKLLKKRPLFLIFMIISTLIFSSCSNNTQPTNEPVISSDDKQMVETLKGDQFSLLQKLSDETLKKNGLTSIGAKEVYEKVVLKGDLNYFVVDIRSPQSFADGHIEGAVNIPYNLTANNRLLTNLPKDKKIIVACYSGHTAGQTAMFWNMLGYDAVPLLNGMGGWKSGAGTALPEGAYNFPVVTGNVESISTSLPSINVENLSNIVSLVIYQSQNYLESNKGPVINAKTLKNDVLDAKKDDYFLVDIRKAEDYQKGHIQGALNIPAKSIAELENLKKIPSDKKIVLIGYQGTDASQIQRVLNQLGYDSYALLQGMRIWTSNKSINGIDPVSANDVENFPLEKLNYDIEGGGGGTATCG